MAQRMLFLAIKIGWERQYAISGNLIPKVKQTLSHDVEKLQALLFNYLQGMLTGNDSNMA